MSVWGRSGGAGWTGNGPGRHKVRMERSSALVGTWQAISERSLFTVSAIKSQKRERRPKAGCAGRVRGGAMMAGTWNMATRLTHGSASIAAGPHCVCLTHPNRNRKGKRLQKQQTNLPIESAEKEKRAGKRRTKTETDPNFDCIAPVPHCVWLI